MSKWPERVFISCATSATCASLQGVKGVSGANKKGRPDAGLFFLFDYGQILAGLFNINIASLICAR